MGMQTDFFFTLLNSNSWDTETNPDSLIDNGLCDVSVGWEDRGIFVTPVTSGIILTVRVCPQLYTWKKVKEHSKPYL